MLRDLTRIYGRVSYEAILSGPGLVNVYQFTHQSFGTSPDADAGRASLPTRLCEAIGGVSDPKELPARISRAAMERTCEHCVEALDIFVVGVRRRSGQHRAAHGRDRRCLHRRRHRAEDSSGAPVRIVSRCVSIEGTDGRLRRDDSNRGDPESRRGTPRRSGSRAAVSRVESHRESHLIVPCLRTKSDVSRSYHGVACAPIRIAGSKIRTAPKPSPGSRRRTG